MIRGRVIRTPVMRVPVFKKVTSKCIPETSEFISLVKSGSGYYWCIPDCRDDMEEALRYFVDFLDSSEILPYFYIPTSIYPNSIFYAQVVEELTARNLPYILEIDSEDRLIGIKDSVYSNPFNVLVGLVSITEDFSGLKKLLYDAKSSGLQTVLKVGVLSGITGELEVLNKLEPFKFVCQHICIINCYEDGDNDDFDGTLLLSQVLASKSLSVSSCSKCLHNTECLGIKLRFNKRYHNGMYYPIKAEVIKNG